MLYPCQNPKNGKWGYTNDPFKKQDVKDWIIKDIYDEAGEFVENHAKVKKGKYYNYIDLFGKESFNDINIIKIGKFSSYTPIIEEGEKYWKFINSKGRMIGNKHNLQYASEFIHGMAVVMVDSKYAFMNLNGKLLKGRYDDVMPFQKNGLASVKVDGKWGCINKSGTEKIECKYLKCIIFDKEILNNLAIGYLADCMVFIDKNGKQVKNAKFDKSVLKICDDNWLLLKRNRHSVCVKIVFEDGAYNIVENKE